MAVEVTDGAGGLGDGEAAVVVGGDRRRCFRRLSPELLWWRRR
jgi:hypothetical protein